MTYAQLPFLVFAILSYCLLAWLWRAVRLSRRPEHFPPGPAGLPIVGNLTQVPSTKSFLKFRQWGEQYGSIIGLKLGPQNVVILNDYQHVLELFERRGGMYSSRPPNHIANDLIFKNNTHILFVPYGQDWRLMRKALQEILRTTAVEQLLPIQNAESTQTLYDLIHDSDRWYDHIRRYSTAVILASVFGLRGEKFDSPKVKALYHVQNQNTAINELGATPPVDIFPFLKKLPDFLCPWRSWARNIRAEYQALLNDLVRDSTKSGKDCFLSRMLAGQGKSGLTTEQITHLGGILMEAGSDTTASTILSFLLALANRPTILKKCQEEIDSIVGTNRVPNESDLPKLRYIRAAMQETLRWRPVAAGGIPHVLTQDDTYGDYVIPKGTTVFANTWAIHRTAEYANPDEFMPERFLDNEFGVSPDLAADSRVPMRRPLYGFGAGRRVCSGQNLAENSMLINMAKIVWGFDLTKEPNTILDESVEGGYEGGFLVCPKPFPLCLVPRSERHIAHIDHDMRQVQPLLDTFKN